MNLQYSITISTDTYLQEASENALQQPGRKQEVLRFTTSLPLLVSVKAPPLKEIIKPLLYSEMDANC